MIFDDEDNRLNFRPVEYKDKKGESFSSIFFL